LAETRQEKPYIFIVVNRFDVIKDKERCKRRIMDQVSELLPETSVMADELVHFISARNVVERYSEPNNFQEPDSSLFAFANLESCLRSFLLEKRFKSKLLPVKRYINNLLDDIHRLSQSNRSTAQKELDSTENALSHVSPQRMQLQQFHQSFLHTVETSMSETTDAIHQHGRQALERLIATCGSHSSQVRYHGLLYIWSYARALVSNANNHLLEELRRHYTYGHERTLQTATGLYSLAEENVPEWPLAWNGSTPFVSVSQWMPSSMPNTIPGDLIEVQLGWQDLVEVPSNLGMMTLSFGSASVVMAGFVGYRRVVSGVARMGSMMGLTSWTQLVATTAALCSKYLLFV
jgi:mitofusin